MFLSEVYYKPTNHKPLLCWGLGTTCKKLYLWSSCSHNCFAYAEMMDHMLSGQLMYIQQVDDKKWMCLGSCPSINYAIAQI